MKRLVNHTVVRYLLAGGSSAAVNILSLYFFNSILHIYYLTASILSFVIAFGVSWALQKFWTFRDHQTENPYRQGALYLMTSLFGLSLNTLILYIAVERVHTPVLPGQILAGGLVASANFFIAKHLVFKPQPVIAEPETVAD